MNDFLQSIRNGNHKRYDGNRKQYGNYANRGNDRHRGHSSLQRTINKEYWPALKQVLDDIANYQKRMADADERRAQAEERKAEALECIAQHVTGLMPSVAATDPQDPSESLKQEDIEADNPEPEDALDIIRRMRSENVSYEKIAAYLTAEGIPMPSGKGKWRGPAVSRIYKQNL